MSGGNGERLTGFWLAFTPDTPEEAAVARFAEKHGYPPREVHRSGGLLLVGPVIREGLPNRGRSSRFGEQPGR